MKMYTHNKGYSLVEVLVAVSILLVATVGPMTIAAKGIQASRFATEQATAIFMAQEGLESAVAVRNQSILYAIRRHSDLSRSWDWVTNTPSPPEFGQDTAPCFTPTGCNMDLANHNPANPIQDCATDSCVVKYRYNASTLSPQWVPFSVSQAASGNVADDTLYTRVITMEEVVPNREVRITSTVSWDSPLFSGPNPEQVQLVTTVFNIYE